MGIVKLLAFNYHFDWNILSTAVTPVAHRTYFQVNTTRFFFVSSLVSYCVAGLADRVRDFHLLAYKFLNEPKSAACCASGNEHSSVHCTSHSYSPVGHASEPSSWFVDGFFFLIFLFVRCSKYSVTEKQHVISALAWRCMRTWYDKWNFRGEKGFQKIIFVRKRRGKKKLQMPFAVTMSKII